MGKAVLFIMGCCISLMAMAEVTPSEIPDARPMNVEPSRVGNFDIYYSAFPSLSIPPEVARLNHLERGPRQGILNVSVRNVRDSATGKAAEARVTGTTQNLLGQRASLKFVKIVEQGAIYYLANFSFTHQEMLRFTIHVQPEGSSESDTRVWSQQFVEEGK